MKKKKFGKWDSEFLAQTKVICKCGHSINFISNLPYVECSYCHRIVFRSKKDEFNFRIKRRFTSNESKEKN